MQYTTASGQRAETPTKMWEQIDVNEFAADIDNFIQNLQVLGYHYQVNMSDGTPLFFVVPTPNWTE